MSACSSQAHQLLLSWWGRGAFGAGGRAWRRACGRWGHGAFVWRHTSTCVRRSVSLTYNAKIYTYSCTQR
eukprot:4104709-Prymnesium_polylepis.2